MPKRILFFIILILLVTSLAASPRVTDDVIDWWAIGPSSATLQQDEVQVHAVIGQGISGEVSQAQIDLCSGYLCVYWKWIGKIFMPLIAR